MTQMQQLLQQLAINQQVTPQSVEQLQQQVAASQILLNNLQQRSLAQKGII